MTRWLLIGGVVAVLVLAAFYEGGRRADNRAAAYAEQAALTAAREKRSAEQAASAKAADEIAHWKATAARYEAETRRLASAARAAAKEVETVKKAGDVLRAAPADQVLAECARQGYQCRMAGAR